MRRPSPALIVALIALFRSLAGTSWAVTQLPSNSVGTKQLKKDAVTGAKVKAGSLDATDFKAGSLPAGPQGERGLAGSAGPTGPQGPAGADAVTQVAGARTDTGTTMAANGSAVELLHISSGGSPLTPTASTRVTAWLSVGMYKRGDDYNKDSRVMCGVWI